MSNESIEQEIVAKGKTAPRVTPQHIESLIVSEHYFTAAQGDRQSKEDSWADPLGQIEKSPAPLNYLTVCVLVLRNGFTVTGESACASPENFDAEIGKKIARENAINKIWPLEGYLLKQKLSESPRTELPSHQQRVVEELAELNDKLDKLIKFINDENSIFVTLDSEEQTRLHEQAVYMTEYKNILTERIAAF